MSQATSDTPPAPRKRKGKSLLFGLILMILGGGGGFYAVWSGLLGQNSGEAAEAETPDAPEAPLQDVSFVSFEPLIISIGDPDRGRHLRFAAAVEVAPQYEEEVRKIQPRLVDIMNTYLRAVDASVLSDPAATVRIRAQLLRRLQLVAGDGRVRDVLVTEFVIN